MEIAGLPLHPLVVHAAVVLTPLAAALAVAFALLPRHRWLTRWPTVLTTLAAFGSVWVARFSGSSLAEGLPAELIETHRSRGMLLSLVMVAFTALVLLAAWALGGPSALVSGGGARESRAASAHTAVVVLVVVAALAVLVLVALTGDAGARAVWG